MNKPYDSTTKDLLELDPAAWVEFLQAGLGLPGTYRTIDADLSTITTEADKV